MRSHGELIRMTVHYMFTKLQVTWFLFCVVCFYKRYAYLCVFENLVISYEIEQVISLSTSKAINTARWKNGLALSLQPNVLCLPNYSFSFNKTGSQLTVGADKWWDSSVLASIARKIFCMKRWHLFYCMLFLLWIQLLKYIALLHVAQVNDAFFIFKAL